MCNWKIIERRDGMAVKWERVDADPNRITITKEKRCSRSGGLGGVRYVVRADNVDREYGALTLDAAKEYAGFWVGVWSRTLV